MIQALLAKYAMQLILSAVLALAAGGGFVGMKIHYTNVGYRQAIDKVAADDKEAIDAADQSRERVRNCRDTGGVWDVTEGICGRR